MFTKHAEDGRAGVVLPPEAKRAGFLSPSAIPINAVPSREPPPVPSSDATTEGVVLIGRGTRIVGDVYDCSTLEIQGSVEGRVSAKSLIVREGGTVSGEIHADVAEVHGDIGGTIQVSGMLDVRSTGRVSGNVAYSRLSVAAGGHVFGDVKLSDPPDPTLPKETMQPVPSLSNVHRLGKMTDLPS